MSNRDAKGEVTRLLAAWSNGDQKALTALMPIVYDELLLMARQHLRRERVGHTLPSSALIHEAYLRLVKQDIQWQNRAHFLGVACQAMRRVLVDYARAQKRAKRDRGQLRVSLAEAPDWAKPLELDFIALNDALDRLAAIDERQSRIVELRYFGGLTIEETAEALGVSPATVKNEWSLSKAWLYHQLFRQ